MRTLSVISALCLISLLAFTQVLPLSIDSMVDFDHYDFKRLEIISEVHDSTDCGEWGGHVEKITIYKYDGLVWLRYVRNPNECNKIGFLRGTFPKIYQEYGDTLTPIKQAYVKEYIYKLATYDLADSMMSNCLDYFEVKFIKGSYTYSFRVEDSADYWVEYKLFLAHIME